MKTTNGVHGTGADVGGAPTVLTGRPTVAPNSGAGLQSKNLRGFAASDFSVAEWCRLPAPRARCGLTGLSRTGLNELIDAGQIRAITVRKPGAARGVKLINLASLRAWLRRLDEEQNGRIEGKVC